MDMDNQVVLRCRNYEPYSEGVKYGKQQREKEILNAINLLISSDYNSKEFMLFKSDLLEMIN